MPGRNLVGDLSRLHPSPDLSALGRSITNRTSSFRSPSFPSSASAPRSSPSRLAHGTREGREKKRCREGYSRSRAGSRIVRSIDRSADKQNHVRPRRARAPRSTGVLSASTRLGRRGGETLGRLRRRDRSISSTIDVTFSRARSRGLSLSWSGPRSDRGHWASATAAEISYLLAPSKGASDRKRAHVVYESAAMHHVQICCACPPPCVLMRVRVPNVRTRLWSCTIGESGADFTLWVVD